MAIMGVLPSWIVLDEANQLLNITPPQVSSVTQYTYYIETDVYSTIFSRKIQLTVTPSNSSSLSQTAKSTVLFGIQGEKLVATAAAASITVSVCSAIFTGGGFQGFWGLVGQYQFYILIPLIGPSVPQKILDFLEGIQLCLFNFNFFDTQDIPVFSNIEDFFDCESETDYYFSIGLESKCGLINNLKIIISHLVIISLHLLVIITYISCRKWESKITTPVCYLFRLLTFTYYVRYLIEGFMILLLGSVREIYNSDLSTTHEQLSYIISILIILASYSFIIFSWILGKKASSPDFEEKIIYFPSLY